MTKRPRLLVLLSRVPYPLDKGDKLRAFNQIKGLSNHFSIILVCLNTGNQNKSRVEKLQPYCESLHFIQINKLAILWRLFLNLFSDKPFQIAYFHSKNAQKELDSIIEKYLPQRFFCQLIRVAEYAKKYSIFEKTIDYMDALSVGMERRLNTSNVFIRPFVKIESKRLAKYEKEIFNSFEKKLIISQQDKDHIDHPNKSQIKIIPNGIAEEYFEKIDIKSKFDICFTGNMSYAPNVEGAQYIVKKILPLLNANQINPKTLISGVTPSILVKRLASKDVEIGGWVNDMRESYAKSKIFVAPMVIGSGLQNKLLEAMASGTPCITTSLANQALGAVDGESILIANSPEEFAEHIIALLNSEERIKTIGKAGQDFVLKKFSWNYWNNQLIKLIESN
ncbi:MAG: glycosyltransferase [Salibacteraceae bacterium]